MSNIEFIEKPPFLDDKEYIITAYEWDKEICEKFGPRPSTSKAEREAAKYFHEQLKKISDDTIYDEFKTIPNLYPVGLTRQTALFVFIAVPFFFLKTPWNIFSVILPIFGFFIFFSSLFLMKEWFGFPYKKRTSQNVFGILKLNHNNKEKNLNKKENNNENKKPTQPVRVVVGGHLDSAIEFNIQKYGDAMTKLTFIALLYVILMIILGIFKTILWYIIPETIHMKSIGLFEFTIIDVIFGVLSILGLPFFVFIIMGYTGKTRVHGANDNLIGVGIAYALGKYFSKPENRLKNIEFWFGGFGSEECGERGSHAFVKKYGKKGLLDNSFTFIPESCGAGTNLAVISEEKMHFAKHDPDACKKMYNGYLEYKKKAGEDAVPCEIMALPMAASDAGRFSHAGFKASTLLGFEGRIMKPTNWHSIHDIPENLDFKMILASYETIKNAILLLDEELERKKQVTN